MRAQLVTPRSDPGTPGTFYANYQTYNTWLRANYSGFSDALIDIANDNRVGDPGDEADPVYYNYHDGTPTDLVHMNGDTPGGTPTGTGGYYLVYLLADSVLPH